MSYLQVRSHRIARGVTISICLSAVWIATPCDATEPGSLEPSIKSPVLRFAPRDILVKFKHGASQERIALILKNNQIEVIAEIQRGYLYHVRVLDTRSVESAITQLKSHQEIEYAEPNYRYETKK